MTAASNASINHKVAHTHDFSRGMLPRLVMYLQLAVSRRIE